MINSKVIEEMHYASPTPIQHLLNTILTTTANNSNNSNIK